MRVAAATAGASTLDDVLELAAEQARSVLEAASLSVSRFEREECQIRTLINVGALGPGEERYPQDESYPFADFPLVEKLIRERRPYFHSIDDPDCNPATANVLRQLEKSSELGVPIVVDGEVWGEVWATRVAGEADFDAADAEFLELIAEQFAIVIGHAEHLSRVSILAYEDPLTGLPNRRAFEERLEQAQPQRTLMLCDLDGLKKINDSGGHESGDRALCAVAEALVPACIEVPGAFAARLSGDEFCALIEGGRLADGVTVAARLLELLNSTPERFTVSCGVAEATEVTDKAKLLEAADTALYAAKREGGARVCSVAVDERRSKRRAYNHISELSAPEQFLAAIDRLAADLDGPLAGSSVLDRLEVVAMTLTEVGEFAAWAVSKVERGSDLLVDLSVGENRGRRFERVRPGPGRGEYLLSDFPITAEVVEAGSGCFLAERSDPTAHESELRLLDEYEMLSVVGAVGIDQGDAYLVELYGDEHTVSPQKIRAALRLTVRAAMPPRTAVPD
ncbi:MAG: sensor domain-containing diguanylate cyclase [Solirubrobacterales bacterium]|nr:sensor domain-containing diguanylate cyclase [Solirubrobacterales bacterium]